MHGKHIRWQSGAKGHTGTLQWGGPISLTNSLGKANFPAGGQNDSTGGGDGWGAAETGAGQPPPPSDACAVGKHPYPACGCRCRATTADFSRSADPHPHRPPRPRQTRSSRGAATRHARTQCAATAAGRRGSLPFSRAYAQARLAASAAGGQGPTPTHRGGRRRRARLGMARPRPVIRTGLLPGATCAPGG